MTTKTISLALALAALGLTPNPARAQTAVAAGLAHATHVHGVGDGSEWIVAQFREQFGPNGSYLLDFWHVSDYLTAAATALAPARALAWRHDQQGRLLTNHSVHVLQALGAHL